MRYSEGNLNRLQIAGELHVKSGKVLDAARGPELDCPLDFELLTTEASWENRAQMCRTSARDYVEALLLDVHHARYLQAHPHVRIATSLQQDQILGDAEATLTRCDRGDVLDRLHDEARIANLNASDGRIRSDRIEPEALFWAAWSALAAPEKYAIAREAVSGFIERVDQAASMDPRSTAVAIRWNGIAIEFTHSFGKRSRRPAPTRAIGYNGSATPGFRASVTIEHGGRAGRS